jgi:hypothetical protein
MAIEIKVIDLLTETMTDLSTRDLKAEIETLALAIHQRAEMTLNPTIDLETEMTTHVDQTTINLRIIEVDLEIGSPTTETTLNLVFPPEAETTLATRRDHRTKEISLRAGIITDLSQEIARDSPQEIDPGIHLRTILRARAGQIEVTPEDKIDPRRPDRAIAEMSLEAETDLKRSERPIPP